MWIEGKRYNSQEKYSEDGSVLITDENEKNDLYQINLKIKNFMVQKTIFLETLEKMMTLTCDVLEYKDKFDFGLMVSLFNYFHKFSFNFFN